MKYPLMALILILSASQAFAAPYITLYPKSPKSHMWGPVEVITCADTNVVGTDCGGNYTMYGAMIEVSSGTITLPPVQQGMWACVKSTVEDWIYIDIAAADRWKLDGVALADGNKISSDGGLDDTVCFYGDSEDGWSTVHNPDSFVDGGP